VLAGLGEVPDGVLPSGRFSGAIIANGGQSAGAISWARLVRLAQEPGMTPSGHRAAQLHGQAALPVRAEPVYSREATSRTEPGNASSPVSSASRPTPDEQQAGERRRTTSVWSGSRQAASVPGVC
jgi:hypothetical protein